MSSTSSKLKGPVRICALSCEKSRGAVFFGGFWKRDIHRMEGSKCGSPPSWFERDQFRTLLVQSNPSAEIWRIAGSHAAPYHFGLEVDSGPLLCNQTMAQNRLLCPCEPSPFKIHSSISQGRFLVLIPWDPIRHPLPSSYTPPTDSTAAHCCSSSIEGFTRQPPRNLFNHNTASK